MKTLADKIKFVLLLILSLACLSISVLRVVACFGVFDSDKDDHISSEDKEEQQIAQEIPEPKQYIIQYTDDFGHHELTVTEDCEYSIDNIPQRTGYDFLGLFDSEIGGVQYISSEGLSLSPYTDNKNLVLFPQYKPKTYTLYLDYQWLKEDKEETTIQYNDLIDFLPKDVSFQDCKFSGWYTKPNCEGVLISDKNGAIPDTAVVNSDNFSLQSDSFTLYAGFTNKVSLYVGNQYEQIEVPYNTPITEIISSFKVNDMLPISWAIDSDKTQLFDGNITSNEILYAVDFAPYIRFDSNGGTEVNSIIANEGADIKLPQSEKEGYFFAGWYTESGEKFDSQVMPSESVVLKAGWYAPSTTVIVDGDKYKLSNSVEGVDDSNRSVYDLGLKIPNSGEIWLNVEYSLVLDSEEDIWRAGFAFGNDKNQYRIVANTIDEVGIVKFSARVELTLSNSYLAYMPYAVRLASKPLLIPRPTPHVIYFNTSITICEVTITIYYPDTSMVYL